MQVFPLLSIFASLLATTSGVSAGLVGSGAWQSTGKLECAKETVAYEGFIGEDNNVQVTYSHCDDAPHVAPANGELLSKRQSNSVVNVCGAQCNTFCSDLGSNVGPTQADCQVIADALLYDSQNIGPLFNISASGTIPTDRIAMQYQSCFTYFLDQSSSPLEYCRTDWAALVTWLSSDCDEANNAHGGYCLAADQRWYVQVQYSAA